MLELGAGCWGWLPRHEVTHHGITHHALRRIGYTLLEIAIVLVVIGVMAAIAMLRLSAATSAQRVNQAANVVAADLELANALAAQRRVPLELRVDTLGRGYTVSIRDSARVVLRRTLGTESEYKVQQLTATPGAITLFPGGTSSSPVQLVMRIAGHDATVTMSRAGLVRVLQ